MDETERTLRPQPQAKQAPATYRRNLPHYQRQDRTYHVTFVTRGRMTLPQFARSLVLEHCLHDHDVRYVLHAAVVMPDHVHLLMSPLRDETGATYGLAEIMRGIKGASARSVNRAMGRSGALWQQESFDHLLRRDEHLRRTAEYICENPVRAGIVASEDNYRWLWREWVEGAE